LSRVLDATCSATGQVTAEGIVIPGVEILSEGTKASSGILILDGVKAYYLPSSATDIKDLITRLVSIVNQIQTIATGLDAVTVSPGSNAAAIAALATLKTQLDTSKGSLK
jgi:hypothetical protein